MLFGKTALLPSDDGPYRDTLRTLWPTVAVPATFAPPIEAREEGDLITLVFSLAGTDGGRVEVELRGQALFVLGEPAAGTARPVRVFSLAAPIDPAAVEKSIGNGMLTVRVVKSGSRSLVVGTR